MVKAEYQLVSLLKYLPSSGEVVVLSGVTSMLAHPYYSCGTGWGSNDGGGKTFRTCPDRP